MRKWLFSSVSGRNAVNLKSVLVHTITLKPITMLKQQTYLVVLLLAVSFSACSNFFQKIGEDVSSGIDAGALTASVVATLNEDSTKTQLV